MRAGRRRVRILLFSYNYAPSVGGMQSIAAILVRQWLRDGHDVTVITDAPGDAEGASRAPRVLRRASLWSMFREARRAEVIVHNHIWLRTEIVAWLARRPWVVAVHAWIDPDSSLRERLKMASLRLTRVIAVSSALAYYVRENSPTIVPNGYDADVFHEGYDVPRDDGAAFVGRFVRDKGADMAIDAVAEIEGLTLTIIGDGPELAALTLQAEQKGVSERVRFTGVLRGAALAEELNRHRILVVPSRASETFGMVALEGIACGCVLVASNDGGLPDAVGPCGLTFPTNDLAEFVAAVRSARMPEVYEGLRAASAAHLAAHAPDRMAQQYLFVALDGR
jgi:glycosyltransferase involved in cell wall biosynthesis